jgi:hypothetical protein
MSSKRVCMPMQVLLQSPACRRILHEEGYCVQHDRTCLSQL